MVRHEVEDHIVMLAIAGEILSGVIKTHVCADGPDHFHIPRTTNASNLGSKRLRDLYSERTNASGGAINQDLLARLNLCLVAQTLQGSESGHRRRSRLLKRDVVRLHRQCGLACAHILGKGPIARSEYRVARFELRNVPADSFDLPRHITAGFRDLPFAYGGHYATEKSVS